MRSCELETGRGFVLHTSDYASLPGTLAIDADFGLTATREVLEAMADRDRRPRRSFLALGYAGWGGGQLESELRQNVWLTCPPDEELLFGPDHERKWEAALAKIGVSAARLSAHSGRA